MRNEQASKIDNLVRKVNAFLDHELPVKVDPLTEQVFGQLDQDEQKEHHVISK